jgi:plastocyanin
VRSSRWVQLLTDARIGRRELAALSAVAVICGGALGCFSSHEATTATGGACSIELGEAVPGSTVVVIKNFAFGPAELHVRVGERVTWLNCDQDLHTSTADGGQWDSPLLAPGDGFTQTFATAGEFPYHCTPHPFMTGRVIVE